jgi:hypothetical protein
VSEKKSIDIDVLCLAEYLSWARKRQSFSGTFPFICYRGQSCDWPLLPKACRGTDYLKGMPLRREGRMDKTGLQAREDEIISEFRSRLNLEGWSDTEVLAYAQHHGAPTRLLDWTRNPIVALWFAVENKTYDKEDGVFYQIRPEPGEKMVLSSALFKLEHAEGNFPPESIFLFSSPYKVERTDRQRSVFTLSSFRNETPFRPLNELAGVCLRKHIIPAQRKRGLRGLLSELGLDPYSIYGDPDSLGKSLSLLFDYSDLISSGRFQMKELSDD